ncbi:MAG: cation-translocating P-type ATPase [Phycisphaeraceae bacterium]|nr:cation-translocating P-type ATPase [Phycisphaeraceae bacterium]
MRDLDPSQVDQAKRDNPGPWEPPGALAASLCAGALLLVHVVMRFLLKLDWADIPAWISLAIGFVYGAPKAFHAIASRKIDIDVLMILGAGFAAGVGHPEEGALLLFLFVLSGALESRAMVRTRREIEAIHALMPTGALVERNGVWVECPPEDLQPGEHIKIRPGDNVPVDAVILEGVSALDQSTLTGESVPRTASPGDMIFAGTINRDAPIIARVARSASESSLQRILHLVTQARELREPVQRVIDRFSQPYTISVLLVSTAIFFIWWLVVQRTAADAAYTAITLLIVASPCALIIATPTATLAAIARGARAGVLFKGGDAIERLSRLGSVCFDKTGTLTIGRPRLTDLHPAGWSDEKSLLALAAALEVDSTHPLAVAIVQGAAERGISHAQAEKVQAVAGRGIKGIVQGESAVVGNFAFTEPCIPTCLRAHIRETLETIRSRGNIGTVVARCGIGGETGEAGVLVLSDSVRPGAERMVHDMHALGIRPLRMLTGDNRVTARHVAEALELDEWDAELLPEQKVEAVREMKTRAKGRRSAVGVIGDGVNDAPALAMADVSIAIGSIGSDAALESADIVLLSDDLAVVPWAVRLARRARAIVKANILFALSVIVVMGLLTVIGSLIGLRVSLGLGVLAHEGGTLVVVLNSLRLLWVAPLRSEAPAVKSADSDTPQPESALAGATMQ